MHPSLFLATAATLLAPIAFALPTPTPAPNTPVARAGGPAILPIPPSCSISIIYPLPSVPTNPSTTFLPSPKTSSSVLYSAYYPSFSTNTTAMAEQCLQQCYGYGSHTECKTAYWAEDVVVPAGYYGGNGGQLATACLLFTRALGEGDFVGAPEGQGKGAFAARILC